jgi:hypothetical protein
MCMFVDHWPFVLFLLVIVLSVLLLLIIVLSVLLSYFSWPLCCLSFFFWSLCCLSFCPISLGHCVVCPSSFGHCVVCPFVLFLLAIVLSVLRFTDSDYTFGIFKLFLRHNKGDVGIVLFCFVFHFIDTGMVLWKKETNKNTVITVSKSNWKIVEKGNSSYVLIKAYISI